MKILMTGATGFIGQKLGVELCRLGHDLVVVSRNRKTARLNLPFPCEVIEVDLARSLIPVNELEGVEAVIHLMGESVASGRWTPRRKKEILSSRTQSTENLIQSLKSMDSLNHFVSASAIGLYGDRGNEELSEEDLPGQGFLSEVCVKWESAAQQLSVFKPEVKLSIVRIGLVLDEGGGALQQMLFPFQAGVGGVLGHGRQWMSWIHREDLIRVFIHALNQPESAVYNAVAPNPVTNKEFTRQLCQNLNRIQNLPLPSLALKLIFGEMASVLTDSQKVICRTLSQQKFKFKYETLDQAFAEILKNRMNSEEVFESLQYIHHTPEKLFPFFADAKNLEQITPPFLNFKIVNVSEDHLKKGTIIDYKLQIHHLPIHWKTLIQEWNPPLSFVDFQVKGPYQLWHHTHEFKALGPGTLMIDRVRFKLPLGYVGWLVASRWVQKDVQKIFNFRRSVIQEKFAAPDKIT